MKLFYSSFLKSAKALRKEVSTVAVMKDGKMLMGKRRDNGLWTSPGGHLEPGENPLDGAVRELFEESGIKVEPKDLKFIKTIKNKENGYIVHGYRYDVDEKISTSMKNDPDNEVYRWHFKDTSTISDKELHVPRGQGNVLLPEMEKEAGLKEFTQKATLGAMLTGASHHVHADEIARHIKQPATKAVYQAGKAQGFHKSFLNKLKSSGKAVNKAQSAAVNGDAIASAAESAIDKKNIIDHVRDTDKYLQGNGLKIRPNKLKFNYKDVGIEHSKGKITFSGKLGDNTSIKIDPKDKGIALAYSTSF